MAAQTQTMRDGTRKTPGSVMRIYAGEMKDRYIMLLSACNQLEDFCDTWLWTDDMAKEVEKLQKQLADTGNLISAFVSIARLAEILEKERGAEGDKA